MRFIAALGAFWIGQAVGSSTPHIESLASPVTVRLRGLSAASDQIAWASGREGTVLHTIDGGRTWRVTRVPGAEALDFRDVQAFGADEAIAMGAGPGDASRVYRTTDGGANWTLVLRNSDPAGFFDCMDFDGDEGRLLGDPVGGRFQLYASRDRGRTWTSAKGPRAVEGEAAFAASGTCVRRLPDATLVVTGGSRARAHFLPDRFARIGDWHSLEAASASPSPSSGLFSVAERGLDFVAVGGDYKEEARPGARLGFQAFGKVVTLGKDEASLEGVGDRWDGVSFEPWPVFSGAPSGYRSGVACNPAGPVHCVATGPGGTDVLPPASAARKSGSGAPAWMPLSSEGYDSVASAGRVFWFSGDGGRLGRLVLPPSD
jgi:photosystem II stability/assembly factor-like uncharacterized protein